MRFSINVRVMLILLIAVTLSSFAVGLVSYNLFSKALESRFRDNIKLTARHLSAAVSLYMVFKEDRLIRRLVNSILQNPSFKGIEVKNAKGETVFFDGVREGKKVNIPVYVASSEESLLFMPSHRRLLGTIFVYYTEELLRESLKQLILKISVVVVLIVVLMSLVSYYTVSKAVLTPLKSLIEASQEVSKGNLDVYIEPVGPPEIRRLSDAFNDMIRSIKRHQQLLEDFYNRLAQQMVLAEIGSFSLTVAHEIKNPLGIIKGSVDLLRKEELDAETKKQLFNYIEEEIKRIDTLIKDFLKLSKTSDTEIKQVDLREVLTSIVEKIMIEHPEVKVSVACEVDRAFLDDTKLETIVSNLVRNAIEAGAKHITVGVKREDTRLIVSVEDDGPGISEDIKEKIFQPFFTTKKSGTGLGLTIVRREVLAHGGKIWLDDNHSKGCRFVIEIPQEGDHGQDTGR